MHATASSTTRPQESGPAWDVARLFPDQGAWSEGDFLELSRRHNHLLELSDGEIEVLDMPTKSHQRMVRYLCNLLMLFVQDRRLGEALTAPYPVRLWPGKFREPDVVFLLAEHAGRMGEEYADGADLVMEVVSEDRRRDLETKREEYARAGIAEYWIVDPREQQITVLGLDGQSYAVRGVYRTGESARSALLGGLEVDVTSVFEAAKGRT